MAATVLKPPAPLVFDPARSSVFLAGSIEMGRATDWQAELTAALSDLDLVVLNPRRDAWDASWKQSIDNPAFRAQVDWELDAQERATLILFYFAPSTQAPITLLELGLAATSGKVIVCCPEGYWRRGNVEVVCARHGLPMAADLGALAAAARQRLAR